MWFVGKRVALVRRFIELGGGPSPYVGLTGTITEMIEPHLYHVFGRHGSTWATCNCIVRWDGDPRPNYQHTSQLEPIIPDSEASTLTAEELLQLGEEVPA